MDGRGGGRVLIEGCEGCCTGVERDVRAARMERRWG